VGFAGRRWRVVEVEGELAVHSATCPHRLGPLDAAPLENGQVICPWHGYRFDVRSGRGCEAAHRLRLEEPPRLVIDPGSGLVTLGGPAPAGS
jgi:nitrite reductase/ring-hydroxylating ferredoxin subunit